ncbi:MAG: MlaC/ttg2D family ABC transporter substrate-binding protein [Wenzhouxiangella sp.]
MMVSRLFAPLALLGALVLSAPSLAFDDPVQLIRETTAELFALVDENRQAYENDPSLLEDELQRVLMPRIDTIHSARLVLGRHGRGQSREDIEAFAEALADLLLSRYATGLLEFRSREQVEILPLSGDNTERQTRVRTRVRLDSGSRAPVDYVLRKNDGEWQVFDVIVEGISYVATFRNQINEEIRRSSFQDVLSRLRAGEIEIEVDNNGS